MICDQELVTFACKMLTSISLSVVQPHRVLEAFPDILTSYVGARNIGRDKPVCECTKIKRTNIQSGKRTVEYNFTFDDNFVKNVGIPATEYEEFKEYVETYIRLHELNTVKFTIVDPGYDIDFEDVVNSVIPTTYMSYEYGAKNAGTCTITFRPKNEPTNEQVQAVIDKCRVGANQKIIYGPRISESGFSNVLQVIKRTTGINSINIDDIRHKVVNNVIEITWGDLKLINYHIEKIAAAL